MGYCTYNGQRIPGTKEFCNPSVKAGVKWVEEDTDAETTGGFIDAVSSLWDEDKPEKFTDYIERRFEEDPYKLAFDAAMWVVPGGLAVKGAGKMANILQKTFRKPTPAVPGTPAITTPASTTLARPTAQPLTRTKVPSYLINAPNAGRTVATLNASRFGLPTGQLSRYGLPTATTRAGTAAIPAGTAFAPGRLALTGTVLGAGAYGVDRSLYPMTEQGRALAQERENAAMLPAIKQIDAAKTQENVEQAAGQAAQAERDRIDNMGFFDKWKLGMKDPTTAALFGAGLRDIGSNIPGQNQMGELQAELADADTRQTAAEFNAQKVERQTLMKLFTPKKPFLIGKSKEKREKQAAQKVAKYYAVRAQMFKEGMPTDHDSIMAMLEKLYG